MFTGVIPLCFLFSAILGQISRVYWSEGGAIRVSPLDTPAPTTLISGLDAVESVSVDTLCEDKVFWTTGDFGEIGRANLDGSDPQETHVSIRTAGIVAHPRARAVYWSVSDSDDSVYRANYEFASVTQIASFPDVQMGRISLDFGNEKIYWWIQQCPGDICNRAVFYRSDLDGENEEALFALNLTVVTDIAVNELNGYVYWITAFGSPSGIWRRKINEFGLAEQIRSLTGANSIRHLAVEPGTGRVVWTEPAVGWQIWVGDSQAQNAVLVVDNIPAEPHGLAVAFDHTLIDCNLNGLEDRCELNETDCQGNGVLDSCDIDIGTSADCNANQLPDECESQSDCNENATQDICDIAGGLSQDINGNLVPDECEIIPPSLTTPPDDPSKTRFLSLSVPPYTLGATALRVHLSSLHHVSPPYTGGPSMSFTIFEGQVRWVGPPAVYLETSSNDGWFYAAPLQCVPHYRDWSSLPPGPFGQQELIHVTGSAIVPSSVYEVVNVAASCQGNEVSCTAVSAPLTIATTRWGDVETPYNPPSAATQPDLGDVAALVNKFKGAPGAPIKARALLAGDDAFGNILPSTLALDLGFGHIAACVDAFKGKPYPHTIQACP